MLLSPPSHFAVHIQHRHPSCHGPGCRNYLIYSPFKRLTFYPLHHPLASSTRRLAPLSSRHMVRWRVQALGSHGTRATYPVPGNMRKPGRRGMTMNHWSEKHVRLRMARRSYAIWLFQYMILGSGWVRIDDKQDLGVPRDVARSTVHGRYFVHP